MLTSNTISRRYFAPFASLCLLALSSLAGHAQVSAYGIVGVNSYGFSYQGSSPNYYDLTAGFGGGAFYNFPIQSRMTVGLDGRVFYGPGSYGGTLAVAALRVGFVPKVNRLRPYFDVGGGMVTSVADPGFDATRVTNGALALIFGLDIRLSDAVDLRAVEWGGAAGYSSTGAASQVGFLDTGMVYHFRPAKHE